MMNGSSSKRMKTSHKFTNSQVFLLLVIHLSISWKNQYSFYY